MGFSKVGEREIHRGPLLTMFEGTFTDPHGGRFTRELVHHPGAVSVVPLLDDGATVLLVRQYRAAVERDLLEIPAGKRDVAGEAPELTAHRELAEEVGMRAGQLEPLAEFYNSPGFCDEHSFVFLASDLSAVPASAQGIEEEHMTVEKVALADVPRLIAEGEIVDAKTIIGLLMARDRVTVGPG